MISIEIVDPEDIRTIFFKDLIILKIYIQFCSDLTSFSLMSVIVIHKMVSYTESQDFSLTKENVLRECQIICSYDN